MAVFKVSTPSFMGKVLAFTGFGSVLSYSSVWLFMTAFEMEFKTVYMIAGITGLMLVLFYVFYFPKFPEKEEQRKKMILRKQYWL
ncbi:MAG: MFS transporter, partial [Pelagibacteraceae bacterium]|nr:MFS transporter [Pelagibacteraceae bacterium]